MKLINWLAFTLIIGFLCIATFYVVEPYVLEHVPYYNESGKWYWTWTLWIFSGIVIGMFWIGLWNLATPPVKRARRRIA